MIDIEIDVFDAVYPAVEPLVAPGGFKSVYVPNPSAFPHATLYETDNVTYRPFRTSSKRSEDYAVITYEANVYALNKASCRQVMNALDTAMVNLGFTRTFCSFVPNLADSNVFRYTARYQAAVDENKVIYRRG